jgi:hypothetical protein
MQTVVGLGKAGCEIAEHFTPYPEYNILKIDTGLPISSTTHTLKPQIAPELYESSAPDLEAFFKNVASEVLFITSCGMVSGVALRVLKQLNPKATITLMYITPDPVGLPEINRLQNNLLFNVFQEYARSAVFDKIFLIDNKRVSDVIGDTAVLQYWNKINHAITSTYHMINVFEHTEPVFSTFSPRLPTARIATIGRAAWKKNEENLFFSLDIPREKRYYYAVPQQMLEEDTALMARIQKQVKIGVEHDKMKVSYGIYSTQYSEPYVYCESNSSMIQKLPAL